MQQIPPWEVDGLPEGVRARDFEVASTYFMTGLFYWGKRLIPVHPDRHGWYFRLLGTHYEHNITRLISLLTYSPMHIDDYLGRRQRYYPAILLPDPSPALPGTTARPVAVCSHSGYIGSAWQEAATELRPEVDDALSQGKYMFTRLRLEENTDNLSHPIGWEPKVWLPCQQSD